MLNVFARASMSRVTDPIGAWLIRLGLTPNAVTVIGTAGVVLGAVVLFPLGYLFAGTLVVTFFVLFDIFDGAMARSAGRGTRFGTVLDASCDRIADGAVLGALVWWSFVVAGDRVTGAAALLGLVGAEVISYVKARAEATGLAADGGLLERAERMIIALVGTGLAGLGVPYVLPGALWLLAVLSWITVGQRLYAVAQSAGEIRR